MQGSGAGEKITVWENFWIQKKILVRYKDLEYGKISGPGKNYCPGKNLGPGKILGSEIFLGLGKILVWEKVTVQEKCWFWKKFLGLGQFWKKIGFQINFRIKEFFWNT